MLKLVKFSKLKNNAGFTSSRTGSLNKLYVKTGKTCSALGEHGICIMSDEKVWADDSQIKPWWKLW